ncbi:ABC transporter ATP-binding protein [uncultured Campylobacter sp.]|jgi:lipoprotein-releasing system ATP-binding protein lolD|uniref:cell division ATP-binding protein FtsE n=1 Tax=Campylobacter sp. TaxID=205 RepID=UPI0025DA7013|nr:ABC transporter ATP-binding protein [uncultured Campylobacter sp.]
MQKIISASGLCLGYENEQNLITDAKFDIYSDDFVFITGQSGSGKSTLLKSFYGQMKPSAGSLSVCLTDMTDITQQNLDKLRQRIGVVFQNYRLISEWNIEKNVMLPLMIKGLSASVCKNQATKLLKHVNLLHRADKFPNELSGGEQQRAAMARALAHNPNLLLCDEPTGSLDEYSSDVIWGLLRSAKEYLGTCIVVVTHHIPVSLRVPYRHLVIENGRIYEIL